MYCNQLIVSAALCLLTSTTEVFASNAQSPKKFLHLETPKETASESDKTPKIRTTIGSLLQEHGYNKTASLGHPTNATDRHSRPVPLVHLLGSHPRTHHRVQTMHSGLLTDLLAGDDSLLPLPFWQVMDRLSKTEVPGDLKVDTARFSSPLLHPASSFSDRWRGLTESATSTEWLFLGGMLAMMIAADLGILQHLPETERTHVLLVIFWGLIACSYNLEVWIQMGPEAAKDWLTGYFMEIVFSFDNIFLLHLVATAFTMPRRLMGKAMLFVIFGAIMSRISFLLGIANFAAAIKGVPYIFGLALLLFGVRKLCRKDDLSTIVQPQVVKTFKLCLGDRFGQFYDEDREGIFANCGKKGQVCMTLLGAAISSMLAIDFLCSWEIGLVKMSEIGNGYVCLSSSIMAIFMLRAMLFVIRDWMHRFVYMKHSAAIVLAFLGAQTFATSFSHVNTLASTGIVLTIICMASILSIVPHSIEGWFTALGLRDSESSASA